jgi:CrcB protein
MSIRMLMITGFCGGFSTFSAFSFETIELVRSGNSLYAVLNVVISISLCLGIIYIFTRSQA